MVCYNININYNYSHISGVIYFLEDPGGLFEGGLYSYLYLIPEGLFEGGVYSRGLYSNI